MAPNLGRPGSPSRAQVESAFLTAGASAVANVRSNGTVAFDAADVTAARRVLDDAAVELRTVDRAPTAGLLDAPDPSTTSRLR